METIDIRKTMKKIFLLTFLIVSPLFSFNSAGHNFNIINHESETCIAEAMIWLSPSCAHCNDYYHSVVTKLKTIPGFCFKVKFMPHLFPLDMAATALTWADGEAKVQEYASLILRNQKLWLEPSMKYPIGNTTRQQKVSDSIEFFIKNLNKYPEIMALDKSRNANTIQIKLETFLTSDDPYVFLKIFALSIGFSVNKISRVLGKGFVNQSIMYEIFQHIPLSVDKHGNAEPAYVSPFFTDVDDNTGISSAMLENGILTPSAAKKMVDEAKKKDDPEHINELSSQLQQQIINGTATTAAIENNQ